MEVRGIFALIREPSRYLRMEMTIGKETPMEPPSIKEQAKAMFRKMQETTPMSQETKRVLARMLSGLLREEPSANT